MAWWWLCISCGRLILSQAMSWVNLKKCLHSFQLCMERWIFLPSLRATQSPITLNLRLMGIHFVVLDGGNRSVRWECYLKYNMNYQQFISIPIHNCHYDQNHRMELSWFLFFIHFRSLDIIGGSIVSPGWGNRGYSPVVAWVDCWVFFIVLGV